MNKYLKIIEFEAREKSLGNMLFSAFFVALVLFIFFHIWNDVLPDKLLGYSVPQMIWYLAYAETLMFSTKVDWVKQIGEDVKSGALTATLLKPVNYIGMQLARLTGNCICTIIVFSALLFPITYFMVGPIPFHIVHIPFILLAAIGAAILGFTIVILLGLLTFWFEDATAMYWIYQKCIFIAGGMFVPLDIFPNWLHPYIMYLPFSFVSYMPTKLLVAFSWNTFVQTLTGQFVYCVLGMLLMYFVYHLGIQKVNIHGG